MERTDGKDNGRFVLKGRRALVTGAGNRVGAAIAEGLGAEGMHVAIAYRNSREGATATAERVRRAGGEASLFQADLTDPGAPQGLVEEVIASLGGLDVLVASAANFERVSFDDIDDGHWDRALRLNLRVTFDLVQAARESLRANRGAIVMITGFCTQAPYKNYLPYVVSKGAAAHLMRVLSLELAPEIRVNAVAPGTVLPPEDYTEAQIQALIEEVPLGRVGSAEAVADAVVHLASASYTTGQEIVVDGGRTVA